MKITNTPTDHLKKTVMDAVVKAYKLAGYNVPPARDLAEIVTLTCENLRKYFRNNLTDDITAAFEKGALGDYGDYNGLSVARFHQWMRAFNGSATNQQPREDETPVAPEPTRDRVKDAHNLINAMYSQWLYKGFTIVPASVILPRLISEKRIPEIRIYTQQAREKAASTLAAQARTKRDKYQKIADYIKQNRATEEDNIVLDLFFNDCKNAGLKKIYEDG